MKSSSQFTVEERKSKRSFAEIYEAQSRRPAAPVPVFHGTIRYQEAEEEE